MAGELHYLYGLFSQTADGSTVTNTVVETSIIGSGQGSLSVPANLFIVGNSFNAKIGGIISAQNGDTVTISIKEGATILATTGAITLSPCTTQGWEIELDFTIRSIGASGTVMTNGEFKYNRDTGSYEGYVFNDLGTIDTTVSATLDVTAEWGQAKIQDQIYSTSFVLHKIF